MALQEITDLGLMLRKDCQFHWFNRDYASFDDFLAAFRSSRRKNTRRERRRVRDAGVTVTTAVVSALTGRRVRPDVAMTGEVTLRGRVLQIGGLREKVLAAHRAGIREVLVPVRNAKDEPDIDEHVRSEVKLHYVDHIDQVFERALLDAPAVDAAQ